MTVLVTGGAGYVGSHCALALLERGEETIIIDNLSTGSRKAIHFGVELICGNVGDKELIGKILRKRNIDAIMHLSGSTVASESIQNPSRVTSCLGCSSLSPTVSALPILNSPAGIKIIGGDVMSKIIDAENITEIVPSSYFTLT